RQSALLHGQDDDGVRRCEEDGRGDVEGDRVAGMTGRQPAMKLQRGPRPLARSLPLIVLGLASAAWAGGALAESYLILAIIGDRLTVVTQEQKVGSHIDRNRSQVVPLPDRDFDVYALQLAQASIQKARPA